MTRKRTPPHQWLKEEDNFLASHAGKKRTSWIAKELNLSGQQVETRCTALGLEWRTGNRTHQWSQEEDSYLKKHAGIKSASQIATELDVSKQQVEFHCDELNLQWRTRAAEKKRKEEARKSGSIRYISNRPCPRHEAPLERRVVNGSCIQCETLRTQTPNYRAHQQARKKRTNESFSDLSPEDKRKVFAIYRRARDLTRKTGIKHHVDHIIPIKLGGKHIPENLRVITAKENLEKSASLPESVPEELEKALEVAATINHKPSPKYKESAKKREHIRMTEHAEELGIPVVIYLGWEPKERNNAKQWLSYNPGKVYKDFIERGTTSNAKWEKGAALLGITVNEYKIIPHTTLIRKRKAAAKLIGHPLAKLKKLTADEIKKLRTDALKEQSN